jgi:tRNA1(Val) A37 N6-methylase TrmN6
MRLLVEVVVTVVDKQCESKCSVLRSVDAKVCSYGVRAKMGDRVLDLCCGSGDLAFLLSQKVGLDGEVGVGFAYSIQTSD